jgi:hypothetical protein
MPKESLGPKPKTLPMRHAALLSLLALHAGPAVPESWPEKKCALFAEAWTSAAPVSGGKAPSADFRTGVERFIASGCVAPRDSCPATAADIAIADALAMIVVLEGMATTFLPFSCERAAQP